MTAHDKIVCKARNCNETFRKKVRLKTEKWEKMLD